MDISETIISHVRATDMAIQTNEEHQQEVANLAEMFASAFGMGVFGKIMGLLHDKGKEQLEWQKYIQGVTGYNKEFEIVENNS